MSTIYLFLAFAAAAGVIWVAGIWLVRSTDALDTHFNLGSALGGLILLGIATSLPEIAITVTAAFYHHFAVIIGNLIGGIAIQTVVLVFLDAAMREKKALSFSAASLTLVLEANTVILVVVAAIMAMRTPAVIPGTSISGASILVLILWMVGLWLVNRARLGLPWKAEAIAATPGREHHERRKVINHPPFQKKSVGTIIVIFAAAAVATLAGGVVLEEAGTRLAEHFGLASGLFAATFMAAATALPELSTGIASVRIGDYRLAFSDIFGGNAFMPALFVVADLIAGKSVLSAATQNDMWFAALGVLLTGIYIVGLIVRPKRTYLKVGPDSLLVLILYAVGIAVLFLGHQL
jgi:cation:H+ antiporter